MAQNSKIDLNVLPYLQAFILSGIEKLNHVTRITYFTINISKRWPLLREKGGVVNFNRNLTSLQITNQYVLTVVLSIIIIVIVLSILLLLCPTVCCTRIQWVWLIDIISIQFVLWLHCICTHSKNNMFIILYYINGYLFRP